MGKFWQTVWGHPMWLEWGPLEEWEWRTEAEGLDMGISPWLHRLGALQPGEGGMRGHTSGRPDFPDASLERTSCHDFHLLGRLGVGCGPGGQMGLNLYSPVPGGPQGLKRSEGGQGGLGQLS